MSLHSAQICAYLCTDLSTQICLYIVRLHIVRGERFMPHTQTEPASQNVTTNYSELHWHCCFIWSYDNVSKYILSPDIFIMSWPLQKCSFIVSYYCAVEIMKAPHVELDVGWIWVKDAPILAFLRCSTPRGWWWGSCPWWGWWCRSGGCQRCWSDLGQRCGNSELKAFCDCSNVTWFAALIVAYEPCSSVLAGQDSQ